MGTVVSVFGVEPFRIGGTETFARELSSQLGQPGWKSVLCFLNEPPEQVRRFLALPNVSLEVVADVAGLSWQGTKGIASVLRRYRPQILHLHFTGFLGLYPWLVHLSGVEKTFFTDHTSRPAGYVNSYINTVTPKRHVTVRNNFARGFTSFLYAKTGDDFLIEHNTVLNDAPSMPESWRNVEISDA